MPLLPFFMQIQTKQMTFKVTINILEILFQSFVVDSHIHGQVLVSSVDIGH